MESTKTSVLLVDDDEDLCSLMADFFAQHNFQLEAVHDGRRGLARALEGGFDLVILDVMLPLLDGFMVLQQLRKRSAIPVIMLTARIEQHDRIAGLDSGADDYLPKPFGPEELLSRMRAVLRRAGHTSSAKPVLVESSGIRVNPQAREVKRGDAPVELTSIEFDILETLVRAAGRVVSRDELMAALHQREATPYERSLDVHMSHLRKKLDTPDRTYIRTIRGIGYLFSGETEPRA